MSISAGSDILASDFVASSAGAGDSGKVPKLNALGKLDASFLKFGGTGADGALSQTSGAYNIDLGGAQVVVKNYTSISITGTGSVTFTNPHANGTIIIFKSQGNVILTSSTAPMIDASGKGGASVAQTSNGNFGNGVLVYNAGGTVVSNGSSTNGGGGGAGAGASGASGASGNAGGTCLYSALNYLYKVIPASCGASGAGGSNNGFAGGASGAGGGSLVIECGGALNFTTTNGISVAGANGSNSASSGAGGGGGGGSVFIICNTITANTGTIIKTGGNGGTGPSAGGTGGAGYSLVAINTEFC